MKKLPLILLFPMLATFAFGQNKTEAEKLVEEGIAYHDKGDYEGAISRYDKALQLDKDNLMALAEKAFSTLALNKFDESVALCKKAIKKHPNEEGLKTVFVTYGNALDGLNKTDQSVAVYGDGIKMFPDFFQLYYNKGVSLSSVKKNDEALLCFIKSATLNPQHASSQNAIARILYTQNKNIPSLLAFCRFLILEPQGKRAKGDLELLQKIVKANVKKNGDNEISISLDPKALEDKSPDGKPKENSFTSTEMILNLTAALDFDEKNVHKTEVEQFIRKFDAICASLEETKENNFGFYWDYYAPYFIELKKQKLMEPLAYIVFASSDKEEVTNWLKSHQTELEKFYDWSEGYNWDLK